MVRLRLTENGELQLNSPFDEEYDSWECVAKKGENLIDLTGEDIGMLERVRRFCMRQSLSKSVYDLARGVIVLQMEKEVAKYYILKLGRLCTYPITIMGLAKHDIKNISKAELINLIVGKEILIHVDDDMNIL